MNLQGKCSFFGGVNDSGMALAEGLALYEHWEADLRPDLFLPRGTDPLFGTSQRLRYSTACYIAVRFPKAQYTRPEWQASSWRVKNLKTGQWVKASLVDFGPHERTDRVVDLSYIIGQYLSIKTDDVVSVERLS